MTGPFTRCGTGNSTNCVVDGDTLRIGARRIRLIGIDAPELHSPACPTEAAQAEAATEAGFTVHRGQIILDRPIKDLGLHTVSVQLHPEVTVKIRLNVARSVEEAALQASGKSIQELAAEAEAEAEFEIANLFDEMGAAQDGEDLGRD